MTGRTSVSVGPVSAWHPESALSVSELTELPQMRREHALALGIDRVRSADGLSEIDIAEAAADTALRQAGLAADDVDALLLVQGRAPQYLLASEVTRLQHRLGASRAFVAGIGDLGCVSVSAALALGSALLRGDPRYRNVLVVAAAKTPTRSRYRAPMTILGDGGAAVVLHTSGTGRYELLDHIVRTDGKYADLFRIEYRNTTEDNWSEECADEPTYSFRLAIESTKRFAEMNREILDRRGLTVDDISAVLTQNLSLGAFAFWEEALGAEIDPTCRVNLAQFGHLGPVDVLINLEAAAAARLPGDYVLAMNSSPVAAWSTSLFRRLRDDGPKHVVNR